MTTDHYAPTNATWPTTLPPITRIEAARAARKLARHFGKYESRWCRRIWLSSKPTSGHIRGWGRLVHDVSHRVYDRVWPRAKTHGLVHAQIEQRMIEYVLEKGWLGGVLKRSVRAKPKPTPSDKAARIEAAILRWESKRRRAETALKKLRRRLNYYQRREVA